MREICRCAGALLYCVSAIAIADADWVLRGGKVYSMDATASHYSALVIEGNRLVWMGDSDAAARYIGPDTRLIELDGRAVFPGFWHLPSAIRGRRQPSSMQLSLIGLH